MNMGRIIIHLMGYAIWKFNTFHCRININTVGKSSIYGRFSIYVELSEDMHFLMGNQYIGYDLLRGFWGI